MRKIRNPQANPESKTQIAKAKHLKEHPLEFIGCEICGETKTTLYNTEGKYYCKEHRVTSYD